jgi:hypothetical protein
MGTEEDERTSVHTRFFSFSPEKGAKILKLLPPFFISHEKSRAGVVLGWQPALVTKRGFCFTSYRISFTSVSHKLIVVTTPSIFVILFN